MAFPNFKAPPKIPDAPSVPRNRSISDIFKPKSSKVPSVTGQGKVDAPRIQMLIENYRTNPNGVRNLYLNMPEDAQMNLLLEIAKEFPPARPGDPLSGVGQELFDFLESGEGVADSSVRREVLLNDNRDAMRPGPSTSRGDSFVTGESRSKTLGVTGDERGDQLTNLEIDEFLDNPEATGSIDRTPPENPQNRYSKAAKDAAALGYTKGRLGEGENFRGTERVATVEDGQPTNQSIPGTGRPSDSADMERSPAGQEFAQRQIDKNGDTRRADMVAEKDNSSYFDSYQKGIVGMMNNSRNPDSLGGNRIDQLWGLISKTGDDPRTMFGSAEAMADVMLGYVNPKMVDNMMNPSPIGQQLPASQRSRMSYDLIKEQLVKQINQKYGDKWGAASAADLSKADTLEADGVNNPDAALDAVTPVDDLPDLPNRQRLNQSGFGGDDPETYLRQNGYTDEDIERILLENSDPDDPYGGGRNALLEEALYVDGQIADAQASRTSDTGDFRDDYDPIGPREEPTGAAPGSTKDRMMYAERAQQERFDIFQERMDELMAEGLSVDEAMTVMEGEGIGRDYLQAGIDHVELIDRYGREMPPPPPPRSVKAAQEQKIGANGPEPPPPPTLKKGIEQPLGLREAIAILRRNAIDPTGMLADDIIKQATNININKQANGPIPPQNTGKKPSKGELGSTETNKTNTGDLDGTSEGDQIDNLESSSTELPDDGKKTDTDGFNFHTDKEGKPLDSKKKKKQEVDKTETNDTKETWLNYPYRHPFKTAGGAGLLYLGANLLRGDRTVQSEPKEMLPPKGSGGSGGSGGELPPGMAPNGGFEKDENGVLTDAGLEALLERSRRRRSSRPRINTGTQTMGNWIR